MRHDKDASIQLNDVQSLYLLGQKLDSSSLHYLELLIEKCQKSGEFLSFHQSSDWLSCYAKDAQSIYDRLPLLVFRPHTIADIIPFLQICYEMDISVTTRCGGTGLSGGCVPSKMSIVLLTGHFNQIKEYDNTNGIISIEPGVTVRQLNRYVANEGWYFPLSLATEGTAGIAGCLSCHSKGYHQQQQVIYDLIEQVRIIDGQGKIIDVPVWFVCGAEGLWGIIVELKICLKKLPSQVKQFSYSGSWENVFMQLPQLRSIHSLTNLVWFKERFYFKLEGEDWRLPSSVAFLAETLPGIEQESIPLEKISQKFLSSRSNFITMSSSFQTNQLLEACTWSMEKAQFLQLECIQMIDILAGSLHLILQTDGDRYSFSQKMEQYLVIWADFVDRQQGTLGMTHGIGMQMRPYMPPFWTEETQRIWRNLQTIFDPKHLFNRDHFFPVFGKSLEKINHHFLSF